MSEIQASLRKVEELREQLHLTIKTRALTDPEVLALSHRLDDALSEYRLLTKQPCARSDERHFGRGGA